ncbi:MAG: mevalonate kinase [Anaerolineae bacterium]|nr:mevalonate kinase [Anaerolineae bacterium]MDW8071156.1 mevalonate kinase [Anaerolineae bacterium]
MWEGRAPGKVILFGEHAVVYGRPAIAVPVRGVEARVTVRPGERGSGIWLECCDLPALAPGEGTCRYPVREAPAGDPLRVAVLLGLTYLGIAPSQEPDLVLTISSTIPIARGLGSGAAVATALLRALATYFNQPLSAEETSRLVYEVEKLFHGTPSGIDNTVIAYQQPVYFVPGEPVELLQVGVPFHLVIADTGIASVTRQVVGTVRQRWQAERARYEYLFDTIAALVRAAREAIVRGEWRALGPLMNENQTLLNEMGVSSPELDRLLKVARSAGALGAKLSGAGRGGFMIALVAEEDIAPVTEALERAGAAQVLSTCVMAASDD